MKPSSITAHDDSFKNILSGMKKEILSSELLWYCVQCYTCYARCPQDVRFTARQLPDRGGKAKGPIRLALDEPPKGITARSAVIPPDESEATLTIRAEIGYYRLGSPNRGPKHWQVLK